MIMRNNTTKLSLLRKIVVCACLVGLWGCSGDTDGGPAGDEDFGGSQFVGEDSGSIDIDIENTDNQIAVSDTSSFRVHVRDANSGGVPQIKVSCDSEDGVAILEPTQGVEFTDEFGNMSGRIGCTRPGSFQFGCRLPVGGNLRSFTTVKCTGDVPTGFGGFPGAAGGGIGGGVSVGGPNGADSDTVRITTLSFVDLGDSGTASTSIDTQQDVCESTEAEPFFDTLLNVTVVNNSATLIRFTKLSYAVDNATGSNSAVLNSRELSLIGESAALAAGESSTVTSLVFDASGGRKAFVGQGGNSLIPVSLGFRTVTVRLFGTTDLGEEVIITGRTTLSFDDFDNC